MARKKRLDELLLERFPDYTLRQIQSWIMQGKVRVDDTVVTKAGFPFATDAPIVLAINEPKYVSRAGLKLEKALDTFHIDVTDLVVLDAGQSTGGFTDCLLQRGAKKVYGVDVGHSQVHEKMRNDNRVVVLERTNLRSLRDVGELVDMITLDLSFISITKVMDAVVALLKPEGKLITLIKPQFEAEKKQVEKGGVVRDPAVHKEVVERVVRSIEDKGFEKQGVIDSPITGATSGNKEFLAYFKRTDKQNISSKG